MTACRRRYRPGAPSTTVQPVWRPVVHGASFVEVARTLCSFRSWRRCPGPEGVPPNNSVREPFFRSRDTGMVQSALSEHSGGRCFQKPVARS